MADSSPYDILELAQLEALTLPIRTEIMETVSYIGPCSVSDLARHLGAKRPVLHFHVRKLLDTGLLLEAGTRGEGQRRENLYRTPGTPMYVVYDRDDPENVAITTQYARNILARAQRLLAQAFESGRICTGGDGRDTYAAQLTAWLTDEELATVNELIEQLHEVMKPSEPSDAKRLHTLTLALAPIRPGADE
jgi:DNA-binding transcriptional ArsR family regulator